MPCPSPCPLARRFWSPSGGSLHASKPQVVRQNMEEVSPVPLALPALQWGIPSFPPAVCWEDTGGSSPGTQCCSPRVR